MKRLIFLIVVLTFALSACTPAQVVSTAIEAGIEKYQQIQFDNLVEELRKSIEEMGYTVKVTHESFPLEENSPTEEPAERAPAEEPAAPACPLNDKGKQIFFDGPDADGFYHLSSQMPEVKQYQGCKFMVEGRVNLGSHDHHIWAFSGNWSLKVKEASLYAYPYNWNMTDFSTTKAPIAAEFAVGKREIQEHEDTDGFNSSMWIHPEKGAVLEIPGGETLPGVTLPDNGNFTEPKRISVHGVWQDGSDTYLASIGAERTISVASIDGKVVYWEDGKDRIEYNSISAYTMPSSWSLSQAKTWANFKFGSMPTLLR